MNTTTDADPLEIFVVATSAADMVAVVFVAALTIRSLVISKFAVGLSLAHKSKRCFIALYRVK